MHKQSIPIDSKLDNLKENDKIYIVEFEMSDKPQFIFKEFLFKSYLDKTIHIEGIEADEDSILAELRDEKFPDKPLKTDISRGFFLSKKEAADEFYDSIVELSAAVLLAHTKFTNES